MSSSRSRRAFTLPEVLVVLGVIALLAAVLLAALAAVKGTGELAQSTNNLRQIATFMQLYAADNRETIVPSQFDYSANPVPGKVRSGTPNVGNPSEGSWADIIWTVYELGTFPGVNNDAYRYDSPDRFLYEAVGQYTDNPLRSAAPNADNAPMSGPATLPRPHGPGAEEAGEPGYFAANDFFDSTSNGWWSTGQIRAADRSLYLIDSIAGEVIEPLDAPFDTDPVVGTLEVDFRYNDTCLMLFLDGHIEPQGPWLDLDDLQDNRQIRVSNLP